MKKLMINIVALLAVCAVAPALGMKRKNEFPDKVNVKKQKTGLLHRAVLDEDTRYVDTLLEFIEVNSRDEMGRTVLHYAVINGYTELVKLLLEHPNIDIRIQDRDGNTLLHHASLYGYVDFVKALIGPKGINVTIKNNDGFTALDIAYKKGHVDVANALEAQKRLQDDLWDFIGDFDDGGDRLPDGVSVNLQDEDGTTPLHVASTCTYDDLVCFLLGYENINVNLRDNNGQTPLIIASRTAGEDCSPDSYGCLKRTDITKALLRHKDIKVNLSDNTGRTALHHASDHLDGELAKVLLRHKDINVNLPDENGSTPLHLIASWYDHYTPDCVEVGYGAKNTLKALLGYKYTDINIKNKNGHTPLQLASLKGRARVEKLIGDFKKIQNIKIVDSDIVSVLQNMNIDVDFALHIWFCHNRTVLCNALYRQLKSSQEKENLKWFAKEVDLSLAAEHLSTGKQLFDWGLLDMLNIRAGKENHEEYRYAYRVYIKMYNKNKAMLALAKKRKFTDTTFKFSN